jgi:mannan endo-1,4-beta-mannosidase
VSKATAAGKKLIVQEWGACYYDSANNQCGQSGVLSESDRAANIQDWADQFGKAGIPWMYWQILPNADPHEDWDYEVGLGEDIWSTLQDVGNAAAGYSSPFDFSAYLL